MIRNKKVMLICMGLCAFCAVNTVLMRDTQAATCSYLDSHTSVNASLNQACHCDSNACGAMWLSDRASTTDVTSKITVSTDEWNSGKKTVYLHGAILYGGDAYATYIWVSEGSKEIETYNDYLKAQMFVGFSESSLMNLYKYGMNRTGNSEPYNYDIESSVKSLTLDLNMLRDRYGEHGSYDIDLQIFRCYDAGYNDWRGYRLYYPMYYTPENCYSNTSKLSIEVPSVDESVNYKGLVMAFGNNDLNVDWLEQMKSGTDWFVTTNWYGNDDFESPVNYAIEDCDMSTGCYVQFRHRLWASKYNTRGNYHFDRTIYKSDGTVKQQCIHDPSFSQDSNGNMVCSSAAGNWFWHKGENSRIMKKSDWDMDKSYVKIYPGEKVCDSIVFRSKSKTRDGGYSDDESAEICVTAKASLGGVTRAAGFLKTTDAPWGDLEKMDIWREETGTGSGRSLWTIAGNESSEVSYDILNCPASGCPVQFRHYLKNPNGKNSTGYYKIYRSVNAKKVCDESTPFCNGCVTCNEDQSCAGAYGINAAGGLRGKAVVNVNNNGEGSVIFANGSSIELQRDPLIIYPGQTVCETMYFKEKSSDSYQTYTKACATAMGNVYPNIDIKVSNDTMNTGYQKEVYAKPGDELTYKVQYDPGLQYTTDLIVGDAVINDEHVDNSNKNDLKTLFNSRYSGEFRWNNAYRVESNFDDSRFKHNTTYNVGDNEEKTEYIKYENVNDGGVRKIEETAIIDPVDKNNNPADTEVWSTPREVGFIRENKNLRALVASRSDRGPIKSSAVAYVPYNFENAVEINGVNDVLYAGQSGSVTYTPKVNKRWNSVTQGEYATMVKNPKVRVCVHVENKSDCLNKDPEQSGGDAWNASSNSGGSTEAPKPVSFPVPDYPAGTRMCADVSVYPANSGDPKNYSDAEGSHSWSDSVSKCFTIAKRPSFQVWGGSVFANSIEAPLAKKTTIDGYSGETRTFGSWAELALVKNSNNDMASGAGFGYSGPGLAAEPGGHKDGTYDNLTFDGGGGVNVPEVGEVRSALGLKEEDDKGDDDLVEGEFDKATLFYITGNTPITGNITIKKDDNGNIPKIVIYSSGNININCGVKRIDAILIAKGNINTCSNPDGGDAKKAGNAQNQLTINGAIMTNGTLELNRTYGAATGDKSIEPAEIINYDNSMLFFGGNGSDNVSVDPSKLVVQHTRELAPRY